MTNAYFRGDDLNHKHGYSTDSTQNTTDTPGVSGRKLTIILSSLALLGGSLAYFLPSMIEWMISEPRQKRGLANPGELDGRKLQRNRKTRRLSLSR
ncbi:MAG: hypothetical protein U0930_24485 [Pirellulales bacterium]